VIVSRETSVACRLYLNLEDQQFNLRASKKPLACEQSVGERVSVGIRAAGGIELYVEEGGAGRPVIFVHEFAGDHCSWEPQLPYVSRSHRCITFSARGYPPSGVPEDPAACGQEIACQDVIAVLDALKIGPRASDWAFNGRLYGAPRGSAPSEPLLVRRRAWMRMGSSPAERAASVKACEDSAARAPFQRSREN
jgi:hypothetical protein